MFKGVEVFVEIKYKVIGIRLIYSGVEQRFQ